MYLIGLGSNCLWRFEFWEITAREPVLDLVRHRLLTGLGVAVSGDVLWLEPGKRGCFH